MSIYFVMNFFIIEISPEIKEKTSFNMYILFPTRKEVDLWGLLKEKQKGAYAYYNPSKSFWPLGHGNFCRGMARE